MKFMMKAIYLIWLILATSSVSAFSQNVRFIQSGTIEFEKRINMFAILKRNVSESSGGYAKERYETYVNTQSQFRTLKSQLKFSGNETLFCPILDDGNQAPMMSNNPMVTQNNLIYSDIKSGTRTTQKRIFEKQFINKDIIRKIKWRMTNETRTIAGYECRRANALILDSIYVVAFYTDQIPVSGGPESFNGLPGMILGIALPNENITWFAKRIEDKPIPLSEIRITMKGKSINKDQLKVLIETLAKTSVEFVQSVRKAFLL
jgi:GLPGLI family protein